MPITGVELWRECSSAASSRIIVGRSRNQIQHGSAKYGGRCLGKGPNQNSTRNTKCRGQIDIRTHPIRFHVELQDGPAHGCWPNSQLIFQRVAITAPANQKICYFNYIVAIVYPYVVVFDKIYVFCGVIFGYFLFAIFNLGDRKVYRESRMKLYMYMNRLSASLLL